MDTQWFEEELEPFQIGGQLGEAGEKDTRPEEAWAVRGTIRAYDPKLLEPKPVKAVGPSKFWGVRLGFEFYPPRHGSHFTFARCMARLEPVQKDQPVPTVDDLYPQWLDGEKPFTVSVKFAPALQVAMVNIAPGEIQTNITFGVVGPSVVGYKGINECAPFWELTPSVNRLEGIRNFWLVVEQPAGCSGIQIRVRVEAELQTRWGRIGLRPARYQWAERPIKVIVPEHYPD